MVICAVRRSLKAAGIAIQCTIVLTINTLRDLLRTFLRPLLIIRLSACYLMYSTFMIVENVVRR